MYVCVCNGHSDRDIKMTMTDIVVNVESQPLDGSKIKTYLEKPQRYLMCKQVSKLLNQRYLVFILNLNKF